MPPAFTRRQVLASSMLVGSATVAGCSFGCDRAMPHDAAITTSPADAPSGKVIEFSALPPNEQSVLETAVTEGVARVCMDDDGERAEAFRSLASRTAGEATYLSYEGDHYGLWIRIEDVIHGGTAAPPDGDENPCC